MGMIKRFEVREDVEGRFFLEVDDGSYLDVKSIGDEQDFLLLRNWLKCQLCTCKTLKGCKECLYGYQPTTEEKYRWYKIFECIL